MTAQDIIERIRLAGKESYKHVIMRHGAREPVYGASIADMKAIVKGQKPDYGLAKEHWASGVYDAMYLAGLLADDAAMTRDDLQTWVEEAYCPGLAECAVPWVAAQGRCGLELAERWIESGTELVATAGVYVVGLTDRALRTAAAMGPVNVVVEGTDCKVASPIEMIGKARARGKLGKKRKTVKC